MNLEAIRERLPLYLDDLLPPDEREAVTRELRDRASLRVELEQTAALREALHRAYFISDAAPEHLRRRLLLGKPRKRLVWRPLLVAGVAAAAGVALWTTTIPADAWQSAEGVAGWHRAACQTIAEASFNLPSRIGEYQLANCCAPPPGSPLRAHARYRDPAGREISLFVCTGVVRMKHCEAEAVSPYRRSYERGRIDDISIVKWDSGGRSYILCGSIDESTDMRSIADDVEIARGGGPLPLAFAVIVGR